MRREHFTLSAHGVDWIETDGEPRRPSVTIDFTGPTSELRERLTDPEGEPLDAAAIDVAFRLQGDLDDDPTTGVVAVTDRMTGDFILELNADVDDVLTFLDAARGYGERASGEEGRYEVVILLDDEPFVTYEKGTFLVYDGEGDLLRRHSLIPSGIEL